MKQSRLSFSSSTSLTSNGTSSSSQREHIFVDLDGVLVDFEAGMRKVFNGRNLDTIAPRELWPALARTPDFYANLPWMSDGKQLWQNLLTAGHKPFILTGLPIGKWAEPQKRKWCHEQLSLIGKQRVITCKSKEKHIYASTGSILIDDRISLKEAWVRAGGVFIHHISTIETLRVLTEMDLLNTGSNDNAGGKDGNEKESASEVENTHQATTNATEVTQETVQDKHEGATNIMDKSSSSSTKEQVIIDLT